VLDAFYFNSFSQYSNYADLCEYFTVPKKVLTVTVAYKGQASMYKLLKTENQ